MKRSTLVAIAVFVVLLVLVVVVNDRPVQRGSERVNLTDLDPATVDGLSFAEKAGRLELAKGAAGWALADGMLADPDAVKRALDGLTALDSSDVVSTSSERQAKYGVDADSGLTVELRAGSKKLAELVVGSSENGGSFVREVGEDTIFQAPRPLKHLFPVDAKRWLKLRLADGKLEEATRVEIALAGAAPYAVVPAAEGEEWQLEDASVLPAGFRFDGPGARSLASSAVNLRAKEIVAADARPADDGLAGEHDRITVTTAAGTAVIHLGAATETGDVYARVDGRDDLLLVPEYQAKNVRKGATELRDLRLLAFDPAAATALAIANGRERVELVKGADGAWAPAPGAQLPADLDFDPSTVDRMVQTLPNLRATALAAGVTRAAAGLDAPRAAVTVTLGEGEPVVLAFGAPAPGEADRPTVFAAGNADDAVYELAQFQLERFTRGWESFRRVEPPPQMGGGNPLANLDPETLKKLPPEVRESLMKQMQQEQQKQKLMEQIARQQGGS